MLYEVTFSETLEWNKRNPKVNNKDIVYGHGSTATWPFGAMVISVYFWTLTVICDWLLGLNGDWFVGTTVIIDWLLKTLVMSGWLLKKKKVLEKMAISN